MSSSESACRVCSDRRGGSPPLDLAAGRASSAAIVVDDDTRPTPVARLLPLITDHLLAQRIDPSRIQIVIAVGTHRPMSEASMRERVGDEVFASFGVSNYDAIHHHHIANFIKPHAYVGNLVDNEFYAGVREAAEMVGFDHLFNGVLDYREEIVDLVFGKPIPAFERAVELTLRSCGYEIGEKADVTILSCFPYRILTICSGRSTNMLAPCPRRPPTSSAPAAWRSRSSGMASTPTPCSTALRVKGVTSAERETRGTLPGDTDTPALHWLV